ncbi:transposase [Caldicellulosiruptor acetigenus]|uniref:transposase n=1 Tax=Caldicellulosiruptor acetigenus TaxID=301953 RepID=UPI0001E98B68|nr:transposase [Caldicellulosiruptor acetigenus]
MGNNIEEKYLADIKEVLISAISADTNICIVDSTPLRSTRNDRQAATGACVTLGFYKGYKLHLLCTGKDEIILLSWEITCANVHDSQKIEFLYKHSCNERK